MNSISWEADTDYPVSLATVKNVARISDGAFDEILQDIHIPAATAWAENTTRRSLMAKTHYWVLDEFPYECGQTLRLPRGKIQSVTSIVYYSNNTARTLRGPSSGSPMGTDYREDLRSDSSGVLMPPFNSVWPWVDYDNPAPVTVTFTAGWAKADIPAELKHAISLYCWAAIDPEDSTILEAAESALGAWILR